MTFLRFRRYRPLPFSDNAAPTNSAKAFLGEVPPLRHRPHNVGERKEVSLLRAQERLRLEEGNDLRQQVFPVACDQHHCRVDARSMVLTNATAAQPSQHEVDDLSPLGVLADVELRCRLPTEPRTWIPADRDVE